MTEDDVFSGDWQGTKFFENHAMAWPHLLVYTASVLALLVGLIIIYKKIAGTSPRTK